MGRYYDGDIHGKFWFGVQCSDDIINLVKAEACMYYNWHVCNCVAEIEHQTYCKDCYESKEEHIEDAIENDVYDVDDDDDNRSLYYEEYNVSYCLDKSTHYVELLASMAALKLKIPDEITNEFDKIEQTDNILDAFTGVFDVVLPFVNGMEKKGNEEKHELLVLVARYTLGYQIEYCLRTTDICNVNCEQ